jgi:hypothetical protein
LASAKRRGVKLGGRRRKNVGKDDKGSPIYGDVVNGSAKGRAAARKALRERADARAAEIAPVIAELQAMGITSLRAIAVVLNAKRIPTARGEGLWQPAQVARILDRLDE